MRTYYQITVVSRFGFRAIYTADTLFAGLVQLIKRMREFETLNVRFKKIVD